MKKDKFLRDPSKALPLSKLEIDADKNWEGMGLYNLRGISPGMNLGDIALRGVSVLNPFAPGQAGHVLISSGPGRTPYWAPLSAALDPWIAAPIYINYEGHSIISHYVEASLLGPVEHYINDDNYLAIFPEMTTSKTESVEVPLTTPMLGMLVDCSVSVVVAPPP